MVLYDNRKVGIMGLLECLAPTCVDSEEGASEVKIMRVGGHGESLITYPGPMFVQEVLTDHPGHAVFSAEEVRLAWGDAKPLPPTLLLQPQINACHNHLYLLIPTTHIKPPPGSNNQDVASNSRNRPNRNKHTRHSQSPIRLKILVSRAQLASILQQDHPNMAINLQSLVHPFMKHITRRCISSTNYISYSASRDNWKPSLESIPETSHSHIS